MFGANTDSDTHTDNLNNVKRDLQGQDAGIKISFAKQVLAAEPQLMISCLNLSFQVKCRLLRIILHTYRDSYNQSTRIIKGLAT